MNINNKINYEIKQKQYKKAGAFNRVNCVVRFLWCKLKAIVLWIFSRGSSEYGIPGLTGPMPVFDDDLYIR